MPLAPHTCGLDDTHDHVTWAGRTVASMLMRVFVSFLVDCVFLLDVPAWTFQAHKQWFRLNYMTKIFLSFSGLVKQNKKMLSNCVQLQKERLLGHDREVYDVRIHQSRNVAKQENGKTTQRTGPIEHLKRVCGLSIILFLFSFSVFAVCGKGVNVILLSADDGRPSLVRTAKSLSSAVQNSQLKCGDITPTYLDELLRGMSLICFNWLRVSCEFGNHFSHRFFFCWRCKARAVGYKVQKCNCETYIMYEHPQPIPELKMKIFASLFSEKNGFPDPSLVLRFGSIESLNGYLPWQVRLSEIL